MSYIKTQVAFHSYGSPLHKQQEEAVCVRVCTHNHVQLRFGLIADGIKGTWCFLPRDLRSMYHHTVSRREERLL